MSGDIFWNKSLCTKTIHTSTIQKICSLLRPTLNTTVTPIAWDMVPSCLLPLEFQPLPSSSESLTEPSWWSFPEYFCHQVASSLLHYYLFVYELETYFYFLQKYDWTEFTLLLQKTIFEHCLALFDIII